jgi:DNA-binding beta-propeller fold protein YncE
MRFTRARLYIALAPLLVVATATVSAYGAARPGDGAATPTSPTGTVAGGTVLPNGRLVTPAGATFNLGDFPLGVAVSPDGRLAVGVNSGNGSGLNSGFGSYCTDRRQGTPCPYRDTLPSTVNLKATAGDPATPTYDESLSVVDLRTGLMREVKATPTSYDASPGAADRFNFFYTGLTFSPDGRHLYASGGGNDAIYDFPVQHDVVAPAPIRTVTLTDTVKSEPPIPSYGPANGFTKGMAVTPDGRLLLVAHEFQNTLDIVDTRTYKSSQVALSPPSALGGAYPYAVAVSHDGGTAYVTEQGLNEVAVVRLVRDDGTGTPAGTPEGTIPAGDHPTGLALSPDNTQLYVANANDDTLSIVTLDPATGLRATSVAIVTLPLHALAGQEQLGSTPNAVAVSPDGQRVYVALAGDDAVAVLGTQASFDSGATGTGAAGAASPAAGRLVVGGMIPTGWYPSAVAVGPDGSRVFVASAKGLGSRYLPLTSPLSPAAPAQRGSIDEPFQYDGNNMPGLLQVVPAPDGPTLLSGLDKVRGDIGFAQRGDDSDRSPNNPIPAETITGTTPASLALPVSTPISYVVEIVRENRTFDQVLGDVGQHEGRAVSGTVATVDAMPGYTIFGRDVTPNAHALVGDVASTMGITDPAYATSDNFYSDGEASIQGHWWTAAANANDYLEKSWRDYYSPRNHVYDPVAAIADPKHCSIFTDALLKQTATRGGFTWRNYGELVGFNLGLVNVPQVSPVVPTSPLSSTTQACGTTALVPGPAGAPSPFNTNLTAVQNYIHLDHDDRVVADAFLDDAGLNPNGTTSISGTASPATFTLRNFSYLDMGGDHTGGLQFTNTPRSRVAQNDAGVGRVVQALSHSKYWPNTAIFVMEDDSQDGLDHVDGHRNLLYMLSPYAKHVGPDGKLGYVGHRHYSQASVLKTIELLLGLPYLSTYDQNASPLYDLFQDKNSVDQLTRPSSPADTSADLSPYNSQPYPSFIDEQSACYGPTPPASCGTSGASATSADVKDVARAESKHLDLSGIDRAGPKLEVINWQLAHPTLSVPPQLVQEAQAWIARHGRAGDGD